MALEALDWRFSNVPEAIKALRAEAWHPIEKAEEFGAKDGREVLIFSDAEESHLAFWGKATGSWVSDVGSFLDDRDVTHFRFISPPEGADGI